MNTGNKPRAPHCALGKVIPETMDKFMVKRRAWHEDGHLVIAGDELDRLDWVGREMVRQLGNHLFGERAK